MPATRKGELGELVESARVHRTLEVDDLFHGLPVLRPAKLVEFRFARAPEVENGVLTRQAQEEPALLLPDAHRLLVTPYVALGQPVAQPAIGLPEERHVRLGDADLLFELAIQRLLERLAPADTALRELPASAAGPATEKHLVAVHQDDAHVGAKTIGIDEVAHLSTDSLPQGTASD